MRFPFFSSQDIVTLVIDGVAARLLVTQGNAIRKWASAPLDSGLLIEGIIQEPEKVGKAVAELFSQEEVAKENVITCVSGAHILPKFFTLPAMRQKDLSNAVMYQAKREMPVPLEELVIAWQLLDTGEGHSTVFVIGVPRDSVGVFLETLRYAGVRHKTIDVKPLALARVPNRPTAIVANVEPDSVDVVYLADYSPLLLRSVYFSDRDTSPEGAGKRLADELQRSIRFYNETNRQRPVGVNTPVFLSGGASDYFSLVEALYGSMEYTIERLRPSLTYPEGFPIEEYTTNIGLALKRR